jgi:hypothetical protein
MQRVTFDPVSNREDWIHTSEVVDQDDSPVDLSTATIVVAVRERNHKHIMLTATTADDTITIPATGFFTFTFTEAQMRDLDGSFSYEIGCTIRLNGVTFQYFIGTVPILDGVVE